MIVATHHSAYDWQLVADNAKLIVDTRNATARCDRQARAYREGVIHWLIHTREGFITRLVIGVSILTALAIWDIRKHGRRATRWREYAFLLICVATAIAYGVVNDQVTSAISWEYYYHGKALDKVLGPTTPPDRLALSREAAKIGAMATWSVGLILGVAILIANNPSRHPSRDPSRNRPQRSFRELIKLLPMVIALAVAFAIVVGVLGWFGWLNWISEDFRDMWHADIFRPRRFTAAYGAHLGGYIGGLFGGIVAVIRVLRPPSHGRLDYFSAHCRVAVTAK